MTETRMAPFYCPYCGEEDLRPHAGSATGGGAEGDAGRDGWRCASCARVFALRFIGIAAREGSTS